MLYNYKSKELVQDVIVNDLTAIIEDIHEEYELLHRDEALYIYVPKYMAKEIVKVILDEFNNIKIKECVFSLLDDKLTVKDAELLITLCADGVLFVEEARWNDGRLTNTAGSVLSYVYDGFSKKDIDMLAAYGDSILVFGFDDEESDESKDDRDEDDESNDEYCDRYIISDDDGVHEVTIKCNVGADEALKVIEDMEKRFADMEKRFDRMNRSFSEMDCLRRLLRF